jgi:hypothetical protein
VSGGRVDTIMLLRSQMSGRKGVCGEESQPAKNNFTCT